jgi:predicted enzyme related to lactoylglutathione lyase
MSWQTRTPQFHGMPQFQRAMPVLDCIDMDRSIGFYKEKLGFSASVWGAPASFAILQRGTVTLALALVAFGEAAVSDNWAAYIYVADADALYDELTRLGVDIPDPPANQPYNCRDFVVEDPDGHMLSFGHVLLPDPLGPGLSDRLGRDASGGGDDA